MAARPDLILASSSPRRLALLNQIGIEPDHLVPADIDETPHKGETPRKLAGRLAHMKAIATQHKARQTGIDENALVLGGDTVVAVGRRILPQSRDVGRRCQLPEIALRPHPQGFYRGVLAYPLVVRHGGAWWKPNFALSACPTTKWKRTSLRANGKAKQALRHSRHCRCICDQIAGLLPRGDGACRFMKPSPCLKVKAIRSSSTG